MARYADWDVRLEQFLVSRSGTRFFYGSTDCCLFVADAVLAMTGADIAPEFRGKYRTRKQALEMAKAYSGGGVRKLVLKALEPLPSIVPAFAQRGDIVLIQRKRDYSLGLIAPNGREIVHSAEKGLLRLPLSLAVHAWRI